MHMYTQIRHLLICKNYLQKQMFKFCSLTCIFFFIFAIQLLQHAVCECVYVCTVHFHTLSHQYLYSVDAYTLPIPQLGMVQCTPLFLMAHCTCDKNWPLLILCSCSVSIRDILMHSGFFYGGIQTRGSLRPVAYSIIRDAYAQLHKAYRASPPPLPGYALRILKKTINARRGPL